MWTEGGRCGYCFAPYLYPAVWQRPVPPLPHYPCGHGPAAQRPEPAVPDCVERA